MAKSSIFFLSFVGFMLYTPICCHLKRQNAANYVENRLGLIEPEQALSWLKFTLFLEIAGLQNCVLHLLLLSAFAIFTTEKRPAQSE